MLFSSTRYSFHPWCHNGAQSGACSKSCRLHRHVHYKLPSVGKERSPKYIWGRGNCLVSENVRDLPAKSMLFVGGTALYVMYNSCPITCFTFLDRERKWHWFLGPQSQRRHGTVLFKSRESMPSIPTFCATLICTWHSLQLLSPLQTLPTAQLACMLSLHKLSEAGMVRGFGLDVNAYCHGRFPVTIAVRFVNQGESTRNDFRGNRPSNSCGSRGLVTLVQLFRRSPQRSPTRYGRAGLIDPFHSSQGDNFCYSSCDTDACSPPYPSLDRAWWIAKTGQTYRNCSVSPHLLCHCSNNFPQLSLSSIRRPNC